MRCQLRSLCIEWMCNNRRSGVSSYLFVQYERSRVAFSTSSGSTYRVTVLYWGCSPILYDTIPGKRLACLESDVIVMQLWIN